jgi:carbon-monoxide dehydrogenase large subunit
VTSRGQSLKRFEDHKLLIGAGSFVDDIKLPGILHAMVIRSPHAHAKIRAVNVAEARGFPGVVAVVTAQEIAGVLGELPNSPLWEDPSVLVMNAKGQPVLAIDRVCYVGQAVAMVVADSLEIARDAADLVEVDYEVLEPVLDPLEALKDDAVPIHADVGTNLGMRIFREGGDVDAGFAQADRVVKQHFEVQRLAPAPMENRAVAAHYQSQEDLLTVWDSTQEPHLVWHNLARELGRPEPSVRVIAPDVGGGFGAKGCVYPEEYLVPYMALTLDRPVKWIEDRQENMLSVHEPNPQS